MADYHGWSKKDASTVLNRFALRKERVKPSKIKRYVKSIQCPFPRCHSVVKRIYNHLNDVHQLKPGTERYQEILSFVPSNDVSIISSESLTFDNSSSSSESLDESVWKEIKRKPKKSQKWSLTSKDVYPSSNEESLHDGTQYRREGGGRRGNYPEARKKFSLGRYIIHYNNYHKLTAGAQQNLGKLIIALKLSGPSLVLEIII